MKRFNALKKVLSVIMASCVLVLSVPSESHAASSEALFAQGLANGSVWYSGRIALYHWDSINHIPTGVIASADLYDTRDASLAQAVLDHNNSFYLQSPNASRGWSYVVYDHVGSRYSGVGLTGQPNEGRFLYTDINQGDMLQMIYFVPDGFISKYWFLKLEDPNSFAAKSNHDGFTKGRTYYSNGLNIHTYGLGNKDDIQMMHCWPYELGNKGYLPNGDGGRVMFIFGEDRTQAWDVYFKADGSILFGDYDLYTGKWTTVSSL